MISTFQIWYNSMLFYFIFNCLIFFSSLSFWRFLIFFCQGTLRSDHLWLAETVQHLIFLSYFGDTFKMGCVSWKYIVVHNHPLDFANLFVKLVNAKKIIDYVTWCSLIQSLKLLASNFLFSHFFTTELLNMLLRMLTHVLHI